jgi:hypothetical protein
MNRATNAFLGGAIVCFGYDLAETILDNFEPGNFHVSLVMGALGLLMLSIGVTLAFNQLLPPPDDK